LKRCGEALKIAVDYMDFDDVSAEVLVYLFWGILKWLIVNAFYGFVTIE